MDDWRQMTIAVAGTGPFRHCGAETRLIEINFEARLCSEACIRAKWDEYWAAEREAAAPEG